jgi:hypothetical protein
MSTPLAMLHPEQLDPDDIQAISRDGLIMANPDRRGLRGLSDAM